MSIQDWGAVGELLGSIAVLLTLFYLARQISESNKLARTSSSQVVTDNYISLNDLIISNPALAGCLAQLKAPGAEFTPAETVQLEHYCYRYFAMFAAAQTSYDNGHLDQATYELILGDMRSIFSVYPVLNRFFNVILEREGAGEIDSGIIEALRNAVRMNT